MDADRWRQVEDLFHAVAGLDASARVRVLDQTCAHDSRLRAEVESLVLAHASADTFIEGSALEVAARLMGGEEIDGLPLTGMTVAGFQVLDKIGEGGMGVVYEALDTTLQRRVALKFLRAGAATPGMLDRFAREARAASALNHPGICTVHSIGHENERPFIEMERLEGRTLREQLAGGPADPADVVALAMQVADALDVAHTHGIVHRDLKPANVFQTRRGPAKILDFGIAKLETDADGGPIVGTAAYMSPEQVSGQPVDQRTDLFSLGAVMYEMATGRAAFPGSSTPAIRHAILTLDPAPPSRLNAAVPAALDRIILKALAKDVTARYQHARELRADLKRFERSTARRRQYAVMAAVVLPVLLVGAAAFRYSPFWPAAAAPAYRVRQLTHNASDNSVVNGAMSLDGRYVAYTDSRGIHVHDIDSGATRDVPPAEDLAVVPGAIWDAAPGWLPHGRSFIANLRAASGAGASSIWAVPAEGPPRLLRTGGSAASVSPDGSIVFAVDDQHMSLMDSDGGGARALFEVEPGSTAAEVAWSPDGQRYAYMRGDAARHYTTIETRHLHGGNPSTVFRVDAGEALLGLGWLRDGRLLFSVTQTSSGTSAGTVPCSHWQLRVDGETGRPLDDRAPLAEWLPQCVALSVAAAAQRAVYLHWALQDSIEIAALNADAPAAASRRLTRADGLNIPSGWTRNDESIVFMSDGGGRPMFVLQSVEGGLPTTLADEPDIVGAARLTPDRLSLLYLVQSRRFGSVRQRIMRVPITGGDAAEVASGVFVDGGARCAFEPSVMCAVAESSRDGRQLVITALDPVAGRGRELARIDVAAGAISRWALSPDGERIAVLDARGPRIRIVDIRGGSHDLVVRGWPTLGYVSWTPDGTHVIVPSVDARAATLLVVDMDGNAGVAWREPGAVNISGIPSHDGRRVAIWIRRRSANLWLAEASD